MLYATQNEKDYQLKTASGLFLTYIYVIASQVLKYCAKSHKDNCFDTFMVHLLAFWSLAVKINIFLFFLGKKATSLDTSFCASQKKENKMREGMT